MKDNYNPIRNNPNVLRSRLIASGLVSSLALAGCGSVSEPILRETNPVYDCRVLAAVEQPNTVIIKGVRLLHESGVVRQVVYGVQEPSGRSTILRHHINKQVSLTLAPPALTTSYDIDATVTEISGHHVYQQACQPVTLSAKDFR